MWKTKNKVKITLLALQVWLDTINFDWSYMKDLGLE